MKSRTRIVVRRRWLHRLMLLVGMLALLTACGGTAPTSGGGLSSGTAASSSNVIRIGALATLAGPFAVDGQDALRGVKMAIAEFGGKIGNKTITLVSESSDATPAVARNAARKLIEQDNVDLMIGPLSGDEGLAVRDYAKTQPGKVFLNGSSAADGWTGYLRVQYPGVQARRYLSGGLLVPLQPGRRIYDRILQGGWPRGQEILGSHRHHRLQFCRISNADRYRRHLRRPGRVR